MSKLKPTPNDQRAVVKNSTSKAFKDDADNRANLNNSTTEQFKADQKNRLAQKKK